MNKKIVNSKNSIKIYRELIAFLRQTETFDEDDFDKLNRNTRQLALAIENREIDNDTEAIALLYGTNDTANYKRTKRSLRIFLINQILRINQKGKNNVLEKTLIDLNAEYAAFINLHRAGRKVAAAYIGESIITKSIRYGFNGFIPKVAIELFEHYSISEPNKRKATKFLELYHYYANSLMAERLAQIKYAELMNMYVLEFDPGPKAIEQATRSENELQPHLGKVESIRFYAYFYQISIFKHYGNRNFVSMDMAAEAAYNYFASLKHRRRQIENMFLRKRVEANLILRNIKLSKELLSKILEVSPQGHPNWYNTLEILVTISIHESSFKEAYEFFLLGKSHSNYDNLINVTRKRWGLLEAYINFLQLSGVALESPTMSRFRINRFINDTPQYEEDKKGRNIQLIIAQLLFYIIDNNWDKMEEKIVALQKYGSRYLRKNELFRSQVFIRMLLELPKRRYHPKAIIRHTAKYRIRLEEMAPNIDLNGSTLEIIPYENLWELIIQKLVPPKYLRNSELQKSINLYD